MHGHANHANVLQLKLYSLQRRGERYIIIYICKVTAYGAKTFKTWNIVCYSEPTNRNSAPSLQENAITAFGPWLYNSLPKYPRDIESVKTEKFKLELDKFLKLIPDEPKMPNYVTAAGSTSILHPNFVLYQLTHLRAQGIYQTVHGAVLAAAKPLQVSE